MGEYEDNFCTNMEFSSILITFFVHATEDSNKLKSSVANALGLREDEIAFQSMEGHYGNEIMSAKAHLTGERAQEVGLGIIRGLSQASKATLRSELEQSTDEHDSLFLRIDRQLIDQALVLSDEEPIRVKMKPRFRSGGRKTMLTNYEELMK